MLKREYSVLDQKISLEFEGFDKEAKEISVSTTSKLLDEISDLIKKDQALAESFAIKVEDEDKMAIAQDFFNQAFEIEKNSMAISKIEVKNDNASFKVDLQEGNFMRFAIGLMEKSILEMSKTFPECKLAIEKSEKELAKTLAVFKSTDNVDAMNIMLKDDTLKQEISKLCQKAYANLENFVNEDGTYKVLELKKVIDGISDQEAAFAKLNKEEKIEYKKCLESQNNPNVSKEDAEIGVLNFLFKQKVLSDKELTAGIEQINKNRPKV